MLVLFIPNENHSITNKYATNEFLFQYTDSFRLYAEKVQMKSGIIMVYNVYILLLGAEGTIYTVCCSRGTCISLQNSLRSDFCDFHANLMSWK